MTNENVDLMEKLCYEAQLKLEEAGRVLCPETGEAASEIRCTLDSAIAVVEDLIHHCYLLRPDEPFYDNSVEEPEDADSGKQ